jgi:protein Mpv17
MLARMSARALGVDICTATALGFAGDIACQRLEGTTNDNIDKRRLLAVSLYDGLYIGGFLHFLYQLYPPAVRVAANLVSSAPLRKRLLNQSSFSHALGCAAVDNVHCALIYLPTFFVGVGLLQGESFDAVVTTLRREWREAYAYCTAFWLPFMSLNFLYVPASHRVRAMASANLLWNIVIDFVAHRGPG